MPGTVLNTDGFQVNGTQSLSKKVYSGLGKIVLKIVTNAHFKCFTRRMN